MRINEFVQYFKNVKGNGSTYTAQCPSHDDRQNSLSISTGNDDKILLHCHAGCDNRDILDKIKLKLRDLYPDERAKPQAQNKKVESDYIYRDINGNIVFKSIRYFPKKFKQAKYIPDLKKWEYNLRGIKTVIYKLPEVTEAIKSNKPIFIVEGEKDVENLIKIGYAATCNPAGAGKWKDYYSGFLKDAVCCILPDNDEPGRQHAFKVAKSLLKKAKEVKIIDCVKIYPELKEKGDISDIINILGKDETISRISGLIADTPIFELSENDVNENTDNNEYSYYIKEGGLKCPLLAKYFSEKFRYIFVRDSVKETVQRYIYADGYYKLSSDDNFKRIIKNLIPLNLQDMRDINEVFNLVSIDHDFIKRSQIDADENIINFKNGVLHLDTMELKPHSPDYLCTKRIPCNYIHNAPKPNTEHFSRYMKHLTAGDSKKASLIMQFLGMAISNVKGYRDKKALFMVGAGDTGKSVIRSLAAYLVGEENNSSITLETLEARFGTSIIYGKRLVGSADMSFMTIKELTAFKQITGGDEIAAEYKGENNFNFKFDGVVWFCMNQLPKFGGDKGEHVYDRMLIVECNPNKPEVLDSTLQEKLRTETDYIVSLAIKELKNVINNDYKYIIPSSVKDAREHYKIQNNSFLQFFEECTTERPSGKLTDKCTTKIFYDVYKAWCDDNNNSHKETKKTVGELLKDMGKDGKKILHGTEYWSDFTLTLATKKDYQKAYGHDTLTNLEGEQE